MHCYAYFRPFALFCPVHIILVTDVFWTPVSYFWRDDVSSLGFHINSGWTARLDGQECTLSAALEFQTIVGFALYKTPGGHPGCRPHCFPSQLAAAARCAPRQHRLVFIISIEAVRGRGGTARPPPARPSWRTSPAAAAPTAPSPFRRSPRRSGLLRNAAAAAAAEQMLSRSTPDVLAYVVT